MTEKPREALLVNIPPAKPRALRLWPVKGARRNPSSGIVPPLPSPQGRRKSIHSLPLFPGEKVDRAARFHQRAREGGPTFCLWG